MYCTVFMMIKKCSIATLEMHIKLRMTLHFQYLNTISEQVPSRCVLKEGRKEGRKLISGKKKNTGLGRVILTYLVRPIAKSETSRSQIQKSLRQQKYLA